MNGIYAKDFFPLKPVSGNAFGKSLAVGALLSTLNEFDFAFASNSSLQKDDLAT